MAVTLPVQADIKEFTAHTFEYDIHTTRVFILEHLFEVFLFVIDHSVASHTLQHIHLVITAT
jgi:hypothetical protein